MCIAVNAENRERLTLRKWLALLLPVLAIVALVPAYLVAAPSSDWSDPLLLAVLMALAIVAVRHDVPLPSGISFDATTALALIAVALAGPLPALVVILPPIAVNALSGREKLIRPGNLANLAAYGWYTFASAVFIQALAPAGPGPAMFAVLVGAGAILLVLNWALSPAIYATLWLGHPMRVLVEMFRDGFPTGMVMAALGALTVLLYAAVGLPALALFALVALVPQSALTYVARTRPVAALDPLTATRRYGNALAVQLRLDRPARKELDQVIRLAHTRSVSGEPGEHLGHSVSDWSEISCAAGHVTEWWNGAGGPAGIPGLIIPRSARIAAVARTWAALTAEGSPMLGHREAISHLEAAAGVRLDPAIVHAARVVVAQERTSELEPAPEPRLHHLHVPARLRRVLAAGA
jgi:hypothetical protein